MKILLIHGPNLNLLGTREVDIYGKLTLTEINRRIKQHAKRKGLTLKILQSNGEGEIIDFIHANRKWAQGIVINPAAYTHYSYAIRDAIAAVEIPTVETHLSDIKNREPFRRKSVIKAVCAKQISGFGWESYIRALDYLTR